MEVKVGDKIKILEEYAYGTCEPVGAILDVLAVNDGGKFKTNSTDHKDLEMWFFDTDQFECGAIELIPAYPGHTLEKIREEAITGGLKFDSEKPPMDLIPYEALEEIAKVLAFGEKKYATANWTKGIEMRRLLSAAMRHLGQFNNGQDYDEETKTLHLANAATNLMFAIWMYKNRPDLDNRWAKK